MGNGHRIAAPTSRPAECVEDGPAARRGAQPLPHALFPWGMMLLPTAPHAAQHPMLPGLRGVTWPDLPPGRVQGRLPGAQNRVPASDMDRPGAHAVLPHGRQGLPWEAQGARLPEDRWAARWQAPIRSLSPTEQPAAHLHLADHAEHTAQILRSLSTPAQSSRGRRGRLATITS